MQRLVKKDIFSFDVYITVLLNSGPSELGDMGGGGAAIALKILADRLTLFQSKEGGREAGGAADYTFHIITRTFGF